MTPYCFNCRCNKQFRPNPPENCHPYACPSCGIWATYAETDITKQEFLKKLSEKTPYHPDYEHPLDLDVIKRSKEFVVGAHGWILGLTAGDQFYENTGIRLSEESRAIFNAGSRIKKLFKAEEGILE